MIRSFLILDDGGLTMMRLKMGTGTLVLLHFLIPFKFLPNRLPLLFRDIILFGQVRKKDLSSCKTNYINGQEMI